MHCGGVWSRRNCANNFVINLNGFNVDVISKLINIKWGPFYVWREWDFKHDPVGNWIYRIEDPSCSSSQTSSDQAAVLRWQFECTPYIKLIFATNHFNIHNNNDTLNCIILNNRFRLTYKRQNWRNNSANLSPLSGTNTSHKKEEEEEVLKRTFRIRTNSAERSVCPRKNVEWWWLDGHSLRWHNNIGHHQPPIISSQAV